MPKALKIEFGAISENNVEILRKVNASCFPISYNDNFYKEIVSRLDEGLNKFAYYGGFVVGAVCTRIEPLPSDDTRSRLYIMTLGVLAAYRGRDVGTQLIQSVLDYYETNKDDSLANVDEIALHVQISNNDAIRFYTDRFGFVQGDMVENYYRRIDPPHCYLLYKKLR
jgi:ribosomal protein S18 acetylase RimI-like enzyme